MSLRLLLLLLTVLISGIAIGLEVAHRGWMELFYVHLPLVLTILIGITVVLGIAGVLGYFLFKRWVRRKLEIRGDPTDEELVTSLADKLTNRKGLENPNAQERLHSLMVNLGLYYVRSVAIQRYFLLMGGMLTAAVGTATVFLLYEQNRKLDLQTEQIKIQSQANTVASLLMEGTRRAALSAEQTALFEDIRAEAAAIRADDEGKAGRECRKLEKNQNPNILRACWRPVFLRDGTELELVHLSDNLLQRVRAYALRTTPYPIAIRKSSGEIDIQAPLDEQIDFPELSPERGQLLQTLVQNRVDANLITFEKAMVRGVDFSKAFLVSGGFNQIDFRGVNLSGAVLIGANLTRVNLSEADLSGATLSSANFSGVDLSDANLFNANLLGTKLSDAVLLNTNLSEANTMGSDLAGAHLSGANLSVKNFVFGDMPETHNERSQALKWLRPLFARTRGLNEAKLPEGFVSGCSVEISTTNFLGDTCPAPEGWTIEYEDQPDLPD